MSYEVSRWGHALHRPGCYTLDATRDNREVEMLTLRQARAWMADGAPGPKRKLCSVCRPTLLGVAQ